MARKCNFIDVNCDKDMLNEEGVKKIGTKLAEQKREGANKTAIENEKLSFRSREKHPGERGRKRGSKVRAGPKSLELEEVHTYINQPMFQPKSISSICSLRQRGISRCSKCQQMLEIRR